MDELASPIDMMRDLDADSKSYVVTGLSTTTFNYGEATFEVLSKSNKWLRVIDHSMYGQLHINLDHVVSMRVEVIA